MMPVKLVKVSKTTSVTLRGTSPSVRHFSRPGGESPLTYLVKSAKQRSECVQKAVRYPSDATLCETSGSTQLKCRHVSALRHAPQAQCCLLHWGAPPKPDLTAAAAPAYGGLA